MADDLKTFSIEQARRIALHAQGFAHPRPNAGEVNLGHFKRVMRRVNIVQIDSVNVLVRAQYMPFFSRLGPYPLEMLHQYAYEERRLFEYPVHEASLLPISHLPLVRHRMEGWKPWPRWQELMDRHPEVLESTVGEIREHGALEVADIQHKGERYYGHWRSTSTAKLVLETMLTQGRLAVSDRINSARRDAAMAIKHLVETSEIEPVRVDGVAAAPPLDVDQAHRQMMKLAIESLGIGTSADCADYYRIKRRDAAMAIKHLVETSEIEPVRVDGVRSQMFAAFGIEAPDKLINACAIVSPFDPLAWYRNRLQWLYNFEYRIEIYTPVKQRKYGYYVLPFVLGERFVARVDLKADRKASVLRVPGAFLEAGCDEDYVAHNLALELHAMANWLDLNRVVIGRRGKLTSTLRQAVKRV